MESILDDIRDMIRTEVSGVIRDEVSGVIQEKLENTKKEIDVITQENIEFRKIISKFEYRVFEMESEYEKINEKLKTIADKKEKFEDQITVEPVKKIVNIVDIGKIDEKKQIRDLVMAIVNYGCFVFYLRFKREENLILDYKNKKYVLTNGSTIMLIIPNDTKLIELMYRNMHINNNIFIGQPFFGHNINIKLEDNVTSYVEILKGNYTNFYFSGVNFTDFYNNYYSKLT